MQALHSAHQSDPNKTQCLITAFFPSSEGALSARHLGLDTIPRAAKKAAARFWCLLQDLVDLGHLPPTWSNVPSNHPFIGVEGGRARLKVPPSSTLPEVI